MSTTIVTVENPQFHPGGGRTTPGFTFSVSDANGASVAARLGYDGLSLGGQDKNHIPFAAPPRSAKFKLVYSQADGRCRVLYGLDGQEPINDFPQSQAGIYLKERFTQHTIISLVQDHGSIDVDHFELKPLTVTMKQ